ncbi:hypothetical protein YC2023_044885 [Brassica napus]
MYGKFYTYGNQSLKRSKSYIEMERENFIQFQIATREKEKNTNNSGKDDEIPVWEKKFCEVTGSVP